MTSMNVMERARRAEDDYFRRKDAELIERARNAHRAPVVNHALVLEKRALADALGVHDDALVGTLHAAGFRAGATALLDWMPAIDVAWIDDLDIHERHALKLRIGADPRVDRGLPLITEFLYLQPSEELLEAVREVLRRQLASLEVAERRARLDVILARCEEVGVASGGGWILSGVSGDERRRIAAIRARLSDGESDILAGTYEFPH